VYLDNLAGVQFTLYEVKQELGAFGQSDVSRSRC
jgi:hypothetical protein